MRRVGPALGFLALAGCATVTTGATHRLEIATDPPGATCTVRRDGVVLGDIPATPGALTVTKAPGALRVTCRKDGYEDASGYAFASKQDMIYGNILIGGALGVAIPFARELVGRRVRCRDDLERDHGVPVLVEFDPMPAIRNAS